MHKLSIKSLIQYDRTIKLSFIFGIQNRMGQQLAPIIVNINLSLYSAYYSIYTNIKRVDTVHQSISLPLMLRILFTAYRFVIFFFVLSIFFQLMSTANHIFSNAVIDFLCPIN